MIAALYVAKGGPYFGLEGVDPWDAERDARKYAGPWPVVAHPPCERWGRYWSGGPSAKTRRELGDDGGCFAAALAALQKYGGALEHPADSAAWGHFGLPEPPREGGWVSNDWGKTWACHVEQGHYGHPARKATWLAANVRSRSDLLPLLIWGPCRGKRRLEEGFHSRDERARARAAGIMPVPRISERDRIHTPAAFRDVLLEIARGAA